MFEDQLISKFRVSNFIRHDSTALSVLFYIYKCQTCKVSKIMKDLGLPNKDIISKLEKEKFIIQNPHPEDVDKTFKLSVGGNFLIKEILEEDSELFEELNKIKC